MRLPQHLLGKLNRSRTAAQAPPAHTVFAIRVYMLGYPLRLDDGAGFTAVPEEMLFIPLKHHDDANETYTTYFSTRPFRSAKASTLFSVHETSESGTDGYNIFHSGFRGMGISQFHQSAARSAFSPFNSASY